MFTLQLQCLVLVGSKRDSSRKRKKDWDVADNKCAVLLMPHAHDASYRLMLPSYSHIFEGRLLRSHKLARPSMDIAVTVIRRKYLPLWRYLFQDHSYKYTYTYLSDRAR